MLDDIPIVFYRIWGTDVLFQKTQYTYTFLCTKVSDIVILFAADVRTSIVTYKTNPNCTADRVMVDIIRCP